ncbi:MAG: Fe-S-binding domain-containing protein, partial [Anaerolineales bacterium]|nr:Fe-S-binding domain-containing protein [Anaerolineales bacterium]
MMEFLNNHLLTLILFTPVLAAVIVWTLPREQEKLLKWAALILSLVPLALSILLWYWFEPARPGFQFQEKAIWYSAVNSSYHVGVDGISLTMVLLTAMLTPLTILASFNIKENIKAYLILFFMLEMGMLGVFLMLDLLLFFVFWEFGLVPMYFLR